MVAVVERTEDGLSRAQSRCIRTIIEIIDSLVKFIVLRNQGIPDQPYQFVISSPKSGS